MDRFKMNKIRELLPRRLKKSIDASFLLYNMEDSPHNNSSVLHVNYLQCGDKGSCEES